MSESIQFRLAWSEDLHGKELEDLEEHEVKLCSSFRSLHRKIESAYRNLPWPSEIRRVSVVTKVGGGRGDISAAAKAIGVIQRMAPHLHIDWQLKNSRHDARTFLDLVEDPKHVEIFEERTLLPESDMVVLGPVRSAWDQFSLERCLGHKQKGPCYIFWENAQDESVRVKNTLPHDACGIVKYDPENFKIAHFHLFPISLLGYAPYLTMGLKEGTGIFLDRERMQAPLSTPYACPSYLERIEDELLREQCLAHPGCSFNSGYAHHTMSWERFIDVCAKQEREKDVVIVLNRCGARGAYDVAQFRKHVFTESRCRDLHAIGYGTITLQTRLGEALAEHGEGTRQLTVIVREEFSPTDMKWLQLASERLLTTGDNTFAEAMAARCKLCLYEDPGLFLSVKENFHRQQVKIAEKIDARLAEFITLGTKRKHSVEEKKRFDELLMDPDLDDLTLRYCLHIQEHYNFEPMLADSIKRSIWIDQKLDFLDLEIQALCEAYRKEILAHLSTFDATERVVTINSLDHLTRELLENV